VYVETDILGGAEIVTGHLIDALRPDIEVVAMGPHPRVIEHLARRRPNAEAIIVPPMRSKHELRAFPAHRRILRSLSPSIFQAVLTLQTACQWPLIAARSVSGIAPIAVEHVHPVPDTRRGHAAKRRATRTLSAHVAVSDYLARAVERTYDLRPGSIVTIQNGVPDVPIQPASLPTTEPVVGTARRFEASKGIDVLLRAVALIPDAILFLVGEGEDEQSLRFLAEELGITERVHFIGWNEDARRYLAAFDVVVVPSRAEAFGLIALEAMLAERPVAASAVGGLPEVVEDGRTGLLVPPDDPAALAAALRRLLGDAALRVRMGVRGRERAIERFSVEVMARSYEALYDRLAATNAA
jgi:glycosyltransferase involved in cell wall biosynthesis